MKNALKRAWKKFYAGWMKFAHVLGIINQTILLTLVYFIPFGVTALIRMLGGNPFKRKPEDGSYFQHPDMAPQNLETAERQF